MERVTDTEEIAGHGIHTFIDGREVYIGNAKLMDAQNIAYTENKTAGTVVYVACNNVFAGSIVISDTVKEGSKDAIRDMKQVGVKKTVMLTGDRQAAADAVAAELGMDKEHILMISSGDVLEIDENGAEVVGKVPAGSVFVDGLGVGDVGNIVMRDRQHLAEDGIIIVVLTLQAGSGQLLAGPDIVSRGFCLCARFRESDG